MRFFIGLTLSIFLGVSVGHTATLELPRLRFYPIRYWGHFRVEMRRKRTTDRPVQRGSFPAAHLSQRARGYPFCLWG